MPTLQQNIIATAKAEVGVHEKKVNGHWNNDVKYAAQVPSLEWANFQPWCATFVSWVALQAGAADLYPRTASCDVGGAWFKKLGRWSEYPAIGAQAFYGTARDLNHTGIVVAYGADTITTVEGNTNLSGSAEGDGVYLKTRQRRAANVIGYGYPNFPGGITSADPAWSTGAKATSPTAPAPKPATSTAARVDFFDLSHHNSGVTLTALKAAKAAGALGGWHKATEGSKGFVDVQYPTRRRLFTQAGLGFGGYHFARPATSSGTVQAKAFLTYADVAPGDLAPMLDLEDDGGLSTAALTDWVADFNAEVRRQLGVDVVLYNKFALAKTLGLALWVARYSDAMSAPAVPKPWTSWDLWQFSNGVAGKPDSIAGLGHVDLNTCSTNPAAFVSAHTVPAPDPVVTSPKPAATTITNLQFNTQHTDPANTQPRDLARLADVVGLNEVESLWQRLLLKTMTRFAMFPTLGSAAYVPILWVKSKFTLLDSGSIRVNAGEAGITPARYINWVRLEHNATGKQLTRINTQVVHHIEAAGKPMVYKGAEVADFAGQQDRARQHFVLLRDLIVAQSKYGPVVVGGDFNVDLFAEMKLPRAKRTPWFPLTMLGPVAKPIVPKTGTLGSRAIDWLLVDGCTVTSDEVLPLGPSDHHGRLSVIALP